MSHTLPKLDCPICYSLKLLIRLGHSCHCNLLQQGNKDWRVAGNLAVCLVQAQALGHLQSRLVKNYEGMTVNNVHAMAVDKTRGNRAMTVLTQA